MNEAGCPSVDTLHLTINESFLSEETAETCDSFTWHGQTFDHSGTFYDTILGPAGCDSTFILNLTINPSFSTNLNVEACNEYEWYGETYSESGVYEHLLQSTAGCDSLLALNLTITPAFTTNLNVEACNEYEWYGETFSESGVYEHMLQSTAGCDSLLVLHLTIGQSFSMEENLSACDEFSWHGNTYTESGTYTDFVTNPAGCDSTFVLNLTINPSTVTDINMETCDDYTWFGETYSESGVYEHMLQSTAGCDSLLVLHLTIGQSFSMEESLTACDEFTWHGNTYTESGTYTDFVTNPAGCDSTFVLNLTLGQSYVTMIDSLVNSSSFDWYGQTYTEGGTYEHMLQSMLGCDSLLILNLKLCETLVHPTQEVQTCQLDYEWHGHTYSENGTYYDTIMGENGCEEIFMLQLKFVENILVEMEETACDSFPWQWATDGYLTESGTYTQTLQTEEGCDSILYLKLIVNHSPELTIHGSIQTYVATNLIAGIYDYYVTDSLTIAPNSIDWVCSDPNWIVTPLGNGYRCRLMVTTLGGATLKAIARGEGGCDGHSSLNINSGFFDVDDNPTLEITLFPNPTRNKVTIQSSEEITRIRLVDVLGQVMIDKSNQASDSVTLNVKHLASGVYFIRVSTKAGESVLRMVIAK